MHSTHVGTRQKNPPPITPGYAAARPAAYMAERVLNDEPEVLNLAVFSVFFFYN